jgi:putative membrane protein insertion efficiency factor
VKWVLLFALRTYKRLLSPMFLPACRYVPSCSEYAQEAIERYGALRGSMKAAWRLLRCHPFAHGGFDPVEPTPVCHHSVVGLSSTER